MRTIYIADDGTQFDNMMACKFYEDKLNVFEEVIGKHKVTSTEKKENVKYYTCARCRAVIDSVYLNYLYNSLSRGTHIYSLHGPFDTFKEVYHCYHTEILPRVDDDDYGMYAQNVDSGRWYRVVGEAGCPDTEWHCTLIPME